MLKRYQWKSFDFKLVLLVVALTILGIFVVGSARISVQSRQVMGFGLGFFFMLVFALLDYEFILKFSYGIYAICLLMLGSIFFFGQESFGAVRWIEVAGIRFQPSEPAKVLLILFFAWFFGKYHESVNTLRILLIAAVLIGVPWLMIFRQPDLSTSIVTMFIFIALLFLAGLSYRIIGWVLAVVVPLGIAFFIIILQPEQTLLEGYQVRRILAWLQPERFPDISFQQQNSIMAIGSGQLWGKGLFNDSAASVKNGNFIPEPQTDFIFAVAGEELGFFGSAIILLLLLLITLECIMIGRKAHNLQGRLICGGVAAMIGFQSFVNIAVVTGLFPNTGLTLPFVSYGLTSLVSLYVGIGLVLNVGLQVRRVPSRVT